MLCTICFPTYTGAPQRSSAFSTAITARSTPAQYPRGAASNTRFCPTTGLSLSRSRAPGTRGIPRPITGASVELITQSSYAELPTHYGGGHRGGGTKHPRYTVARRRGLGQTQGVH